MKLPGGDHAFVDRAKLTDYCLNEHHPRGKHKARVFSSILGLTLEDAEFSDDSGKTYAELALKPDQLLVLHHRRQRAA